VQITRQPGSVYYRQSLTEEFVDNLAHAVNDIPWPVMYSMNDCNEQAEFSMIVLILLLKRLFYLGYNVKMSSSDRPWITPYFRLPDTSAVRHFGSKTLR